ncbi:hypothetical protein BJ322DRAFT_1008025 [Thelephora terrestris]|uniref:Uncharacterized protein n=1 Tax=Thelephora terrestris TaxID=56493 RepID=A0A9P6HBF5_9AGAM|nr:hypothetical protein BJ322DRAFT_1008025 [Thelephora terrestris]
MVVTADESSKDNRTIFRRWGHSVKGTPAGVHSRFARGEQYSILAAISVDGYVATRVVVGAVDSITEIEMSLIGFQVIES